MRISVKLPQVEPEVHREPECCPYDGCEGTYFKPHGRKGQPKPLRDMEHKQVISNRWKCVRCNRTFRVYPPGVSQAHQSDRLKAISVLLYVLGLSYGGVSDFLTALGHPIGKTTVYDNVQAAGIASRSRKQSRSEDQRAVIGADATYMKVKGQKVGVQVIVDDSTQELLGLEIITSEKGEEILPLIREIAKQYDAEVLISDDWGAYQGIADDLGLDHQICRNHVKRNVDDRADSMRQQVKRDTIAPKGVLSDPEKLEGHLQQLQALIRERPPDASKQLQNLYEKYQAATKPTRKGQKHSVWYRMRSLIVHLWERWQRLTLDQKRNDLDGTNNASERVIGWWLKERYRTMRGYKRTESIRNVGTLTCLMGAASGDYDMAELY